MRFLLSSAIATVRVPRMDENATLSTPALAAPRAQGLSAESFGLGLAKGMKGVADDMTREAIKEREHADRTRAIESRTALDQAEVDLLYDEKQGGALLKRGKDSFTIVEPTLKAFDERIGAIEAGLSSDEQKEAFRLLAGQRRVEVDKQIQKHVNSELRAYADETNKASLESTLQNVVRNFGDAERVNQERNFGLAVIATEAREKGLPPQVVKARVEAWDSMIHKSIIDRKLVDDPIGAKAYFDENRDKLLPSEVAKVEQSIRPLVTKQEGMNAALELGSLLGTKPLTEVMGDLRTRLKSNPDALNIAETQLKQMESERLFQVKAEAEEAAKPIYSRIAQIQLTGRAAKLSDIPAGEWANLVKKAPEEAGKIQDAIRRELQGEEDRRERKLDREERRQEREERKAERGTMQQLMNWAALNGDPVSLQSANLDQMFTTGLLGKEHYKSLTTKQSELRSNPDKGMTIRSENQVVEDLLGTAKIKKGSEDHGLAWEYIEDRKRQHVTDTGKQPTRKELEEFGREALYKVDVSGKWSDQPAYRVHFEDIPAKERNKIVDAFNRRGSAYTQADVVRAYTRLKMKGGR